MTPITAGFDTLLEQGHKTARVGFLEGLETIKAGGAKDSEVLAASILALAATMDQAVACHCKVMQEIELEKVRALDRLSDSLQTVAEALAEARKE